MGKQKRAAGSPLERPKVIDRYLRLGELERKYKDRRDKLRKKVLRLLRSSEYPGIKLIQTKTQFVNDELAIRFLRKQVQLGNLSKDIFNSLFERVFDPNKFVSLISKNKRLRQAMPEDVIGTRLGEQIRPVKDEEG